RRWSGCRADQVQDIQGAGPSRQCPQQWPVDAANTVISAIWRRSCCQPSAQNAALGLSCAVAKIIKQCHAVGFGPNTDSSGFFECIVVPFNSFLTIKRDREVIPLKIDPQRVPLIGGYFRVRPFLLGAPAIDRVVDGDVVFESIGTRDVVVVGVFGPPNETSCTICLAGNGLELHLHETVPDACVILDANGKCGSTRLFQDVRFAGRCVISLDCPFRRPTAGLGGRPTRRWRAGVETIEVNGVCKRHTASHCGGERYRYPDCCFHGILHSLSLAPFFTGCDPLAYLIASYAIIRDTGRPSSSCSGV